MCGKLTCLASFVFALGLQSIGLAQAKLEGYGAFCSVNGRDLEPSFWVENVGDERAWYPGCTVYLSENTSPGGAILWSGTFLIDYLDPNQPQGIGWGVYPFTCPDDYPVGTYYVVFELTHGGHTSSTQVTITEPPPLPSKPVNPSPSNGATNQSINVVIRWENGGRATSYRVYFGTDPPLDSSEYKGSQTATSYYPGTLNYSTTYYWRIDATNSSGTTRGEVWRFTTAGVSGGVKAEYFAGKIPEGIPCLTQIEPSIDHNWGSNDVACGRRDEVSARWTANLIIPVTDMYTFYTISDDGVRLYLDRERIIDNWIGYGIRDDNSPPLKLVEGRVYPLVMEWYDSSDDAVAQLFWETPTMSRRIIPPGPLQPPQPPQPPPVEDGTGTVIEAGGFENFTDEVEEGMAIFQTWIGGGHPDDLDPDVDNNTGMRVGHLNPPYAEQTIVYSGTQSMPLYYDNSEPPFYSQADRTWDTPQDWTADGIISLHLQVHGRPSNYPEPFYLRVEDTAGNAGVVFNPDPDILVRDEWTGWGVLLSDFADAGVDLTRVRTMSIGMGKPPEVSGKLLNDDCVNAIPIGNVTNLAFDTTSATFDGPGHCSTGPNIWYLYTATQSGSLTVSLCGSSYDTTLSVYDGSDCPPKQENMIRCNDDFCGRQSEVTFYVSAGRDYLIEIGGWEGYTGQGVLNISYKIGLYGRPPNDDCDNAMSVGNVTDLAFDTTHATFDGPGFCMESPNIWYTYTAAYTGNVTVSLCGSSYDSKLAIYRNGSGWYPEEDDLIDCSDDFCGTNAQITFMAVAGNHYLIEVGAYSDETGRGVLNISSEGNLANPILYDAPKLLDNHNPEPGGEGKSEVDQVILAGTKPGILWGYMLDDLGDRILVPNIRVTLVLQTLEFWGETKDTGLYKVDAIQGEFKCTVTKENLSAEIPSLLINELRVRKDLKVPQSSWTPN